MVGIVIGLVLLMFLAYKGMSILWMAPVTAVIVALTGGLDPLNSYIELYMAGFVGFTKSWFPAFMLGAIFGKILDVSGGAKAIAGMLADKIGKDRAILAVLIGCTALGYGGVSVFVIAFTIYPLALALFREANITRKLIPGTLAAGMFTTAMTSLPGTPQIQNLIPMEYFGTDAAAAPILGIIASIIMGGGSYWYLLRRSKYYTSKGEVFIEPTVNTENTLTEDEDLPNPYISLIPLLAVVIVLNIVKAHVVIALLSGVVLALLINFTRLKGEVVNVLNNGAQNSVLAIINTSAAVGFGAVVREVPGFEALTDAILSINITPLAAAAIAVTLMAGATGSSSGGLGIALEALSSRFIAAAEASGTSLEAFHRVSAVASGGLDSLPHNGAIITVLSICGMTHKDSYKEMAVTTIVIPAIATAVIVVLGSMGIV